MGAVVKPEGWPEPRGYAHGVVATGRLLAIAGQLGADDDGRLASREFPDQFAAAVDNVLAVVNAAGGTPQDIIAMTVFVVDMAQYQASRAAIGVAWQRRLGKYFPAMSVVSVNGLVDEGALVEIQALAVLPP
jgi:enamine deaminase RidA (YjgF/YER057c/UK114 family)